MHPFLGVSAFLALGISLSAPWHKQVQRSVPWQSEELPSSDDSRNRLADFFQQLNPSESEKVSSGVQGSGASIVVAERQDETQLRDLPWAEYRKRGGDRRETDFLWPVRQATISSGFGMRRGRVHEGIDLKAPKGSPVRAAASGRVVYASWMRGYGRILVLYHGDGISTVYAHNQQHLVSAGDWVQQGQEIAKLGDSGHTTGAHLHFEVRKDGRAVNPLTFAFREGPLLSGR